MDLPFVCNLVKTRLGMVLHKRMTDKWHVCQGVSLVALPLPPAVCVVH